MIDRTPDPEWQRQADAEPYRIAYSWMRKVWSVVDIRPLDEPTVAGPFRSRDAALTEADRRNLAAHSAA